MRKSEAKSKPTDDKHEKQRRDSMHKMDTKKWYYIPVENSPPSFCLHNAGMGNNIFNRYGLYFLRILTLVID